MTPLRSGNGHDRHILIIDDDHEMCQLIKKFLHMENYRVQTALSGYEGLFLLQQHAFDLVISDLKMPGISGIELIRKARAVSPETPFILITAFGDVSTYIEAMDSGVFEFLNKPIKMQDLKLIIHKALQDQCRECKIS